MFTVGRSVLRVASCASSIRSSVPHRTIGTIAATTSHHATALGHPSNCACPVHANKISVATSATPALSSYTADSFSLADLLTGTMQQPSLLHFDHAPLIPHLQQDALILPEMNPEADEIECAVPKKRTSISRSRHRRAGDRLRNRRRVYQNYRVCFVCGTPVVQHHACTKCLHVPTRA